jgi:hypothetical protein
VNETKSENIHGNRELLGVCVFELSKKNTLKLGGHVKVAWRRKGATRWSPCVQVETKRKGPWL